MVCAQSMISELRPHQTNNELGSERMSELEKDDNLDIPLLTK